MSSTTGSQVALRDIAALVGADALSPDIIERVLESARVAIGASCVTLAVDGWDTGCVSHWSARAEGSDIDAASFEEAAARSCSGESANGVFTAVVPCPAGPKASLACDIVPNEHILAIISGYLSLILANQRMRSDLTRAREHSDKRISELAAVYEVGQAVNELDTDKLLVMVTEKAAAVMDAQACSLLLRDFEANELRIAASWGLSEDIVGGTRVALGEGISGRVAQTGEAMLITDVATDPRFPSGSVRPRIDVVSSICAPLKDESGRAMGVLNIRRHKPASPFTDSDVKLFCVFASQAALAISNAKLYTSLSRRIAEMSTISELLRAINSTLNIEYVLNEIADSIVDIVGFDRCCVYLADPRTGDLVVGVHRGYEGEEPVERLQRGQGVAGLAAREGISIFEREGGGYVPSTEAEEPHGPTLATPIVVRDQCIGVVTVDNSITERLIQPPDVELLSTFVSQAGIAIENARLYEAMEEKYSELNVLFEHSKTISSAYGLENAAHISTAVARKAVACDGCILLLLGDKRSSIALQAAAGLPQYLVDSVRAQLAEEDTVEYIRGLRAATVVREGSDNALSRKSRRALGQIFGKTGSALIVPLLAEDASVGAFVLFRQSRPDFVTAELQLLSIVASQAAVVLKNALRYEQRMHRRVLDLSILYEFSRRISSSSSLEEALDAILGIVSDLVECDESAIYAIDQNRQVMIPTATRCGSGDVERLPEQPLAGNSVMSWTVRERKAMISPDISRDSRFDPVVFGDRPVRSLMSIPLMVQDEAVGLLCVTSASPNMYSEDDVRVLSIIASQSAAIYKELEALAALTSYTDNILTSIAAGVLTLDSDGVILTWNRAAEDIVGLSAPQVVGRRYQDILKALSIADSDKSATRQIVERVRSTGETYQGYKLCYHPTDADVMYLNISASVLLNNAGDPIGLVMIFEEITKEIRLENEFRRMGELAAVGQLAASIAHELRNPLSSIKGAAQFLQKEYEDHTSIVEFLGIIVEEVDGLSKLTTEFLEFARPMEFDIGPANLNDLIRKTLQLMSVHISESGVVTIEHLPGDLPVITADEKQMELVIRNIIINSLQAMPEGGTLSIQTQAVGTRSVALSISDTGLGIPEDKLGRIFVPFFTTKTKGTGLGLSVVQKIVENHEGHIEVTSVVGQGSTFRIVLPVDGVVRTMPPEPDTTERGG